MSNIEERRFAPVFVPNIIGYLRILGVLVGVLAAFDYPALAAAGFFAAIVGDYIDGILARKLNQVSKFGQVLDVVTDIHVMCIALYFILSRLYGDYWLIFVLLAIADGAAHMAWLYHMMITNAANYRSVEAPEGISRVVALYYVPRMLTLVVGSYYFMLLTLYCAANYAGAMPVWIGLALILAPGFGFKVLVHFLKIYVAFSRLAWEPVQQ